MSKSFSGKKLFAYILATVFFISLFYLLRLFHGVAEVSRDGSLLFYNAPVYAKNEQGEYLAYLDSTGKNWLEEIGSGKRLLVHDYYEEVKASGGFSDDHAAPAIISMGGNRILYATAYHGTDMHLYVIDDMSMDGVEHTILKGSYTYPALFDIKGEVILFSREQPAGKMGGDLVAYRASDGFSEKRILMESRDGEVVYAAIPFIADDEMLVAYALHRYSDQSMRDFHVASFGLKTWEKKWECDLGYLVEGAFYNRPTAIAKKDSRILVGTSFFDEAAFLKAETDVFSQENKVLLVEGSSESCASFHVVYERDVAAPYYNTDVNINENLDFVFFDADGYYSNLNLDGCFLDGRNIYPRMVGRKMLIFSRMNGARYNIRNFDNSLYVCRAGMIDFH